VFVSQTPYDPEGRRIDTILRSVQIAYKLTQAGVHKMFKRIGTCILRHMCSWVIPSVLRVHSCGMNASILLLSTCRVLTYAFVGCVVIDPMLLRKSSGLGCCVTSILHQVK
jgi:hypothetical protein